MKNSLRRGALLLRLGVLLCFTIIVIGGNWHEPPEAAEVFRRGPPIPAIALTFDDGPGASTDTILSILRDHDVKATFFVIGKNARGYRESIVRMHAEGHEIANHTYTHPSLASINTPARLRKQITKTDEVIQSICDVTPVYFRPPHGWHSPWMIAECRALGKVMACWTIDSKDWKNIPTASIVGTVLRAARHGSIVLFHDRLNTGKEKRRDALIEALPAIIDSLRQRGYSFMTISQLHDAGIEVQTITEEFSKVDSSAEMGGW